MFRCPPKIDLKLELARDSIRISFGKKKNNCSDRNYRRSSNNIDRVKEIDANKTTFQYERKAITNSEAYSHYRYLSIIARNPTYCVFILRIDRLMTIGL